MGYHRPVRLAGAPIDEPSTDVIQDTLDMLILKTLSLEAQATNWARRVAAIARAAIDPAVTLRAE